VTITPQIDGVADHADLSRAVEPKVRAATLAGGSSAATLLPFVLWLLSVYVFHGDVPLPVQGAAGLLITGACTFAAGWSARHVDRGPAGS
jgi:hypothetical protein